MNISDIGWSVIAPVYRILRKNPIFGFFFNKEIQALQFLLRHLVHKKIVSICDLGVGRGHSLDLVDNTIPVRIAIDNSMAMVRYTRKKYTDVKFLVGDVLSLPLKDSSFDLILCIGLTEYVPKIEPLLEQISLALKQEGFLLITSSPKNILTYLRVFSGHKLFARSYLDVEMEFNNHHFKIIDTKSTAMQHQYLLKKERI